MVPNRTKHHYHSLPHVSVITKNILITIKRFSHHHLLPASNSTFMTDWFHVLRYNSDLSKLEWTLLLFNFNYIPNLINRRKLFSIPIAEYVSFSYQVRMLKTNLLGLISSFCKYYLKTGTICLLFFSSHVFATLKFDSNHFGTLLWKVIKPRDHN